MSAGLGCDADRTRWIDVVVVLGRTFRSVPSELPSLLGFNGDLVSFERLAKWRVLLWMQQRENILSDVQPSYTVGTSKLLEDLSPCRRSLVLGTFANVQLVQPREVWVLV